MAREAVLIFALVGFGVFAFGFVCGWGHSVVRRRRHEHGTPEPEPEPEPAEDVPPLVKEGPIVTGEWDGPAVEPPRHSMEDTPTMDLRQRLRREAGGGPGTGATGDHS